MNIIELQRAIGTKPDGIWGQKSRDALIKAFTNTAAPGITAAEERALATRLRVSVKQLRAVALVESSGGGFDRKGRPKILFERHKFHGFTGGVWSVATFCNPSGGGYGEDSWDKLIGAIVTGSVDVAFMSASWGKFQVMGEYWSDFHYNSPYEMAHSAVSGEAAHYTMLVRYIEHFELQDEMARLSANPEDCRAFARGYNGRRYAEKGYHTKMAAAMK